MQILLTFDNAGIIDIPVNYNYYVQPAIFTLLSYEDADYAEMLHNEAYGGNFRYKMFTFGELNGRCHFYNKKLYYEGDMQLEIRSASDLFSQVLMNSALKSGYMRIGKHDLLVKKVELAACLIADTPIKIRTLTPIIVKEHTNGKKTVYYPPHDDRFIR